MTALRIFTASLATETNSFSPLPTNLSDFKNSFYAAPGHHPETPTLCSAPITELRKAAKQDPNLHVIEGTATWAEPAGLINRETYESLRDEILDQIRNALPLDGVILGLHGAMVAQGYDDCEGDLLERIREIIGPDVFVGAEMDPHSHLTKKRLKHSDLLVFFHEFPHIDFEQRAGHLVDLSLKTIKGLIKPKMACFDCRMIEVLPTSQEPMRSFIDRIKALEGQGSILSVSIVHGFMAADVPELGTRVLVVTDDDEEKGEELAATLGMELYGYRGTTRPPYKSTEEAVKIAKNFDGEQPLVIADVWDNPGGGNSGDATLLLEHVLSEELENVGVATIWDPQAVQICFAAGEGAEIQLRFGGKTDLNGGPPIDAKVTVLKVQAAATQTFGNSIVPMGDCAVIRIGGADIILNSNRAQVFEPTIFSNLGIDPTSKTVLIVKSTNHFYQGFRKLTEHLIYADTGGPYVSDPKKIPYTKLDRDIWPIVENPFQ